MPQRHLRVLIEQLPVVIWTTDRRLRVTSLLGAGLAPLGLEPDQFLGRSLPEAFGSYGFEFPPLVAHRRALDGRVTTFEHRWTTRVFEVYVEPLRGGHGHADDPIDGVIGMALDITDRKRMEEELARLAAIVEFSDDAIMTTTLDGTITSWNGGAERLYGYASSEMLGRSIGCLIPAERASELPEILERVGRGARIESYETVRVRKDGTCVDVSLTISPLKDHAATIIGSSRIARDITASKRLEAAVRRAETLGAVACLAAAAAHEINNPLTVVAGHLQLLAQRSRDEATRGQIEEVLRAISKIEDIIARMRHVTRLEFDGSSPSPLVPTMLDLWKSTAPSAAE